MAKRQLAKYWEYDTGDRLRRDADLALANSDRLLLSRGLIDGALVVHKFGAVNDVGTSLVPVTASETYQTPTVATALEIVSDSADDNGTSSPLGSGALTVKVIGIADWTIGEVSETVTLNGTTPVALSTSFLRVYRMQVMTSGSYATLSAPSHNSIITLRDTASPANVWAIIESEAGFGLGQTEIGVFSIPANYIGFVPSMEVFVEANKAANVIFFVREGADTIVAPYTAMQTKEILRSVAGENVIAPFTPLGPFTGPCDIGFMGASTAQTANIEVDFELVCYETSP